MPEACGTKMKVGGTAIVVGTSRNKIYYSDEELKKGSKTLAGVTILKDHEAKTDNSVGKVEKQKYAEKVQSFEGFVEEDGTNLLSKIKDGRLKVSVGAMVERLVESESDDMVYEAEGIHYMELSLTPTPGVPGTSISPMEEGVKCDVTESIVIESIKSKLSEKEIDSILEEIDFDEEDEKPKGDTEEVEPESKDTVEDSEGSEKKPEDESQETSDSEEQSEEEEGDIPKDGPEQGSEESRKEENTMEEDNKKIVETLEADKVAAEAENKALKEQINAIEKEKFDKVVSEYGVLAVELGLDADCKGLPKEAVEKMTANLQALKEKKTEEAKEAKVIADAEEAKKLVDAEEIKKAEAGVPKGKVPGKEDAITDILEGYSVTSHGTGYALSKEM